MNRDEITLIVRELMEGEAQQDADALVSKLEKETGYPDVLELIEDESDELTPEEIVERIFGYSDLQA